MIFIQHRFQRYYYITVAGLNAMRYMLMLLVVIFWFVQFSSVLSFQHPQGLNQIYLNNAKRLQSQHSRHRTVLHTSIVDSSTLPKKEDKRIRSTASFQRLTPLFLLGENLDYKFILSSDVLIQCLDLKGISFN